MSLQTFARALRRALTEDHTPWANRYVYWIKTPLGVLIVATLASVACGLFVAPQGFALAAVGAATILLGIVWPWLGMRGVQATLRFEKDLVREEDRVEVRFEIENRWPFPVWGLFLAGDELRGMSPDADGPTLAVAAVSGWSKMIVRSSWSPGLRGVYPTQALALRTAFPFGLWTCGKPVDVDASLHVAPRTMELAPCPLPGGQSWTLADPSSSKAGDDGERESVRPYRHGDSLRQVHWALTARHDRIVVCERQSPAAARAVVAIDPQALQGSDADRDSRLEWSLRIACSVAETLLRQNATVEFRLGDEASWTLSPGRGLIGFYRTLAAWKPSCAGRKAAARSNALATSRDELSLRIGGRSSPPLQSGAAKRNGFDVLLSDDAWESEANDASPTVVARRLHVAGPLELRQRFPHAWSRLVQESWRHA